MDKNAEIDALIAKSVFEWTNVRVFSQGAVLGFPPGKTSRFAPKWSSDVSKVVEILDKWSKDGDTWSIDYSEGIFTCIRNGRIVTADSMPIAICVNALWGFYPSGELIELCEFAAVIG